MPLIALSSQGFHLRNAGFRNAGFLSAGRSQDQLCAAGPQRAQLPRLPQVCEAVCTREPSERLHGQRHHSHPLHHRAGCFLWRGFVWPQNPRQPCQAVCYPGVCPYAFNATANVSACSMCITSCTCNTHCRVIFALQILPSAIIPLCPTVSHITMLHMFICYAVWSCTYCLSWPFLGCRELLHTMHIAPVHQIWLRHGPAQKHASPNFVQVPEYAVSNAGASAQLRA